MRTTVRIDDEILANARRVAAQNGETLSNIFEHALRQYLASRNATVQRERIVLPTFRGTGAVPGVDLDDWSTIKAILDQEDVETYRRIAGEDHDQA